MSSNRQVRVGIGVFVLQSTQESRTNPRFLIGQRKGSHGAGTFALPGGHLEFGETPEECGVREVLEGKFLEFQTGLRVKDVKFLTATNSILEAEGFHYITMFMVCTREDEGVEARVLEPEKCEGWEWCAWDEMLSWIRSGDVGGRKVFLPLESLIQQRPHTIPAIKR